MTQKIDFKAEKKNYQQGSVVILQGSDSKEIHFLHKGTVEIKRTGEYIKGLKESDILEKSKRIGVVEAPSIFGVQNLISSNTHQSSYLALTDTLVTKYVLPSNDFISFFKVNPPISLNVLLQMEEQVRKLLLNLKKYTDFIGLIDKLYDNLMLFYLHVNNTKKDELYQKFVNNGGVFPPRIDSNFLTGDYSTILGKVYGDPSFDPKVKFDWEKLNFFRSLLKAKPASFISLLNKDIKIFLYTFQSLSSLLTAINIDSEQFVSTIERKLDHFFLNSSSSFNLTYSILKKIRANNNIDDSLTGSIVKICRNIEHINKQLGGREYIEVFPKYDSFSGAGSDKTEQKVESTADDIGEFKKKFKDSTKLILEYSTLSDDVKKRIHNNITKMSKINTDDLFSKQSRALIKNLQDDYYELYQDIFFKAIKNPASMPDTVKLFIYFSFIDEKLITEKQLEFIFKSLSHYTTNQNTEYPIITMFDFLIKIYNKEEEPSLSEMGEFRKLINKPPMRSQKPIVDTEVGRVEFEIDNMIKNSLRITSDNVRAFIPYLREDSFKGALSQILVSPKKLDAFIKQIVAVDYSLFFRELTWKIPGKSELIKKEVKPYLIIIPNSGVRIQMWQELVYNLRTSRARFLIPIIFNADLNKNLVHSCGAFRWNLNKALVSNWMDPVDGGLTGAYFDYEQSYKKMNDLSIEAKEKIKKQIHTIKIDRNRFAHDYFEWITYESKGVPKLNKVLRKIFYRHIPFPKDIRENVSKLPVYSELDRKFNIVRNRDFKKLESRFRKYASEAGVMPDDLKGFLEMMQA